MVNKRLDLSNVKCIFVLTGMPLGMNREQIEKRLQGEGQFT